MTWSVVLSSILLAIGADAQMGTDRPAPSPTTQMAPPELLEPVRRPPTARRPAQKSVPDVGRGTFDLARGRSTTAGRSGTRIGYRVEVERGVPMSASAFADAVDATLGDDRGWTKDGHYSFRRDEAASLRVVLATPRTTDRLCAPLQTRSDLSCRNGDVVAINAVRWFEGAGTYGDDVDAYRTYVINHEVGHSLGRSHAACPARGVKAPVMLQQTLGLAGCKANPWP